MIAANAVVNVMSIMYVRCESDRGDGKLAARLLIGGTGTWTLAKAVKRIVWRLRQVTLLLGIRRRGRDASGLGYLSGHAGVAVVLGVAALPCLGPGGRALTLTAIPWWD